VSVLRLLLFALPYVVLTLVAILLNQIDAGPEAGFGALCLISVLTGVGIGLYVTRHGNSCSRQCQVSTASRRAARTRH
jgi:hypothetical protein